MWNESQQMGGIMLVYSMVVKHNWDWCRSTKIGFCFNNNQNRKILITIGTDDDNAEGKYFYHSFR